MNRERAAQLAEKAAQEYESKVSHIMNSSKQTPFQFLHFIILMGRNLHRMVCKILALNQKTMLINK